MCELLKHTLINCLQSVCLWKQFVNRKHSIEAFNLPLFFKYQYFVTFIGSAKSRSTTIYVTKSSRLMLLMAPFIIFVE